MKNPLSKTQIDLLGDRLRIGSHTEEDLRLLDDYRLSFGEAYETVVQKIRVHGESPTGRQPKSRLSIVEKLKRQKTRLSKMQDIAGCRVVVADIVQQDEFITTLKMLFPEATVIDRRDKPSHGYRAVHVIVQISGKPIEIQVRTALQHLWAELSEKSSDVIDPTIKYGGGSDEWKSRLASISKSVAANEEFEKKYSYAVAAHEVFERTVAELPEHQESNPNAQELRGELEISRRRIEGLRAEKLRLWNVNANLLNKMISWLDDLKRQKQ